jgi:predicted PurR-regulated permease PerM
MKPEPNSDVTRVMLLILFIGLLLAGSFWTLLPFIGSLIWATTIVTATWPLLSKMERVMGGRRAPAVAVMTLLVLLAFVVPFTFAILTVLDAADRSPAVLRDFLVDGLGPAPAWLHDLPIVGERVGARWAEISAGGPESLVDFVKPYSRALAAWVVAATGGVGIIIIHVLLMVVLVAILYSRGEVAARGILAFANRLGGDRGVETAWLASKAVRSVALGVIVTALVQSVLAGLGLWIAGVPHPGLLTAAVFILGVAQLGPLPILGPAVAWLYWTGSPVTATILLVWSIPVIALDNVLRPILIRRGVELPLLLIIAGVIGGLIGFGVMGLFIGPVLLAATYTLAKAWTMGASAAVLHSEPAATSQIDVDDASSVHLQGIPPPV